MNIQKERLILSYILQSHKKGKVQLLIPEINKKTIAFLRYLAFSRYIFGYTLHKNRIIVFLKYNYNKLGIFSLPNSKVSRYYRYNVIFLRKKTFTEKNSIFVYKTYTNYSDNRSCIEHRIGGMFLFKF